MSDITNGVGLYREDVLTIAQELVRNLGERNTKDTLLLVRIAERLNLAVANASDGVDVFRLDLRAVTI